jgi:hypothetical protein
MTPVRVFLRDIHEWWIHANIEAFSSANAMETIVNDAEAWAGDARKTLMRNETLDDALVLVDRFSRGMSRHLTTSIWRYLFSRTRPTTASRKYRHILHPDDARSMDKQLRQQQHHEIALSHTILHTPSVRAHWIPTEQIHTVDEQMAAYTSTNSPTKQRDIATLPPKEIHARSLLQFLDDKFVKRMNSVQEYSSEVALGEGVVQILPKIVSDKFIEGDMPWPPTYV